MGLCFSIDEKSTPRRKPSKRITNHSAAVGGGSHGWTRNQSSRKEENGIGERAASAAAAILFQQQRVNSGGTAPFNRSASVRYPSWDLRRNQTLPRSSSSRARSVADPLLQPHQLVNQDVKLGDVETKHVVLVHGGGYGAWCWYKTIALSEEAGYQVAAVDLSGSGIHFIDANTITSLSQYVKPLTDYLGNLNHGQKENRIGSSIPKDESNELMQQAQVFVYANGNNQFPTAIDFDISLLKDLLFNQSPAKDIALASVSMRPIPFSPVLEKLSLSETNYGSIRRFYIETLEDNSIPIAVQERMIYESPPEEVFRLKGADHSPFFSKPQSLHKLLVEISKIP